MAVFIELIGPGRSDNSAIAALNSKLTSETSCTRRELAVVFELARSLFRVALSEVEELMAALPTAVETEAKTVLRFYLHGMRTGKCEVRNQDGMKKRC